ncbi:MAG TPA: serine hydrolase [Symbiobacteriaceae bacterium]|nr:serine hydrolase [Symbiobacteriaceae bacterium]
MSLAARIAEIDRAFSGTIGVTAINLTHEEWLNYNGTLSFPPASTVKLPVLCEVFRGAGEGRWSLDDQLTLTAGNVVEGSGVLLDLTPGLRLSIRDVATLMIVLSDNTATNMLIDLVTAQAVNHSLQEWGIAGVQINRKIGMNMEIPLGEATPAGMARLMELIARHELLPPQDCIAMIDILKRQKYKELTNRFIPETDNEDDAPAVRIASKSGWVRGTRNDVAVIWAPKATYVLSMFSKGCKDRRFYHDNEAAIALARISQAVYEEWGKLHV